MIETQYITLDMKPSGVLPILYCSQYDIGRPLGMVVYNGGQAVDLEDYTVTIEATRTDGAAITALVTTNGNIGAFATTATMTNKADKYGAQLVLTAFGKRVASLPFVLCVVKAAMDENSESIEEDASLYQQYTATVQALIEELRNKMRWYVTPEEFGAVGDGVTDDTEAVQRALTHEYVIFKNGTTYATTDVLTVNAHKCTLIGNNATIKATLSEPQQGYVNMNRALSFIRSDDVNVYDLNIESNYIGTFFSGCKNFAVKNGTYKTNRYGIAVSGESGILSENFIIENVIFDNDPTEVESDGVHLDGGTRNGVLRNLCGHTGDDFIAFNVVEGYMDGTIENREISNISVENVTLEYNGVKSSIGIRFYGYGTNTIHDVSFNNCKFVMQDGTQYKTPIVRFLPSGGYGSAALSSATLTVERITFNNCYFETPSENAAYRCVGFIETIGKDLEFTNCVFKCNTSTQFDITNTECQVNVTFKNCRFSRAFEASTWMESRSLVSNSVYTFDSCDFACTENDFAVVNTNALTQFVFNFKNCSITKAQITKGGHSVKNLFVANGGCTIKVIAEGLENPLFDFYDTLNSTNAINLDLTLDRCNLAVVTPKQRMTGYVRIFDSDPVDQNQNNVENVLFDAVNISTIHVIGNGAHCASKNPSPLLGESFVFSASDKMITWNGNRWIPKEINTWMLLGTSTELTIPDECVEVLFNVHYTAGQEICAIVPYIPGSDKRSDVGFYYTSSAYGTIGTQVTSGKKAKVLGVYRNGNETAQYTANVYYR